MTFVHGKDTYISLDGNDLSTYCNTSNLNRTADEHDVTTYGKDDHVFSGGLRSGEAGIAGVYDGSTSASPRAVIDPIIGTVVTLIRRTEGTGSGKPEQSVSVLVRDYQETNPVADMISWSATLRLSDVVTDTTQA